LATLLERLAQIEDLNWVRFLYCYPNRITPRLLDTIAVHPRLAKYLDVPLQHASRSVLARMKRGSNGDTFLKILEKTRKAIPGVSIRTSFIVGFPGETENDFRELCEFVRAAEFDWMGVFAYSDEDSSKSFALQNKVDAKTIARRRDMLMSIQRKISARKLRGKIGQRFQVMVEGPSKDTDLIWEARLEGMAPEIDGKVYVTEFEGVNDAAELPAPGTLATIEITESKDYDLIGRVVEFEKPIPGSVGRQQIAAASPFPILA
jgi:ribosomal protein S12 methylthiotransferase